MPNSNLNKFFISIVAPSILAIVLFIISFFVIIIPQFEQSMMDRKKEMIRELTNSAWSIMQEQNNEFKMGNISIDSAKATAAHQIELMRYGTDRKDYFWIMDYTPSMVMHPYRKELNGTDLATFKDSHEKTLFNDAACLVRNENEGFIDYYWQWKDDTTKVVPKLSYVKGYEPWQWIIGTGIYLEDVRQEIAQLKNRLLAISSIIVGIIVLALIYIISQSLRIENKRKKAERNLLLSKQKYKSLVQASTEGTLMLIAEKIVFNNLKFAELVNTDSKNIIGKNFTDFFTISWSEIMSMITDLNKTVTIETKLLINKNELKEIILSVSSVAHTQQETYILVTKDVSKKIQLEKSATKLSEELHGSLLLMNQPIKPFVHDYLSCSLDTPINQAAKLMTNKNQKIIFIKQNNNIIGAVNDADLKKRVIATQTNTELPVSQIMSSPVSYINEDALLFEAVLLFKRKRVSHLLVTNNLKQTIGIISNQEALEMQRNSITYLIQEIETTHQIEELKQIYNRLPILVNSILANSDNAQSTSRIITSVADAITKKVIELALEKHGAPPCEFSFIAMGSEGRMEQTLKTDQDNAIVFENTANDTENKNYFIYFAKTINNSLNTIGYNFCEGGIMAMNEQWCMPLSNWKKQFSQWTQSPDPKSILDSSIFFDFRFIYGDQTLVSQLRDHILSETKDNTLFFYHMANSLVNYKPSISDETIQLKKILLPFVGFMRVYCLKNNIQVTNTLDRLQQIQDVKVINAEQANELTQIYNFLMQKRLKNQAEAILDNEQPENIILAKELSEIDKNTLKKAMNEINQLQLKLKQDF